MATANYMTMESFPLFAREFTSEIKCCKHCGLYQDSDNDVCEECGGELEEVFHKISVLPGHYYGVQFYVETTDDPTEMDNEDCRYYFDMYRSVAIRRYNSEVNKVCRILRKLAKEYGFDELYLRARFGNGAALYGQVENTNRSRLLQAVAPRR